MDDEKPVLEALDEDFKAALTTAVYTHKVSIDAWDEELRSQKTLVLELYEHFHGQNARVNKLVKAMDELDGKLGKLAEKLDVLEDKIIAALCKPTGPVC